MPISNDECKDLLEFTRNAVFKHGLEVLDDNIMDAISSFEDSEFDTLLHYIKHLTMYSANGSTRDFNRTLETLNSVIDSSSHQKITGIDLILNQVNSDETAESVTLNGIDELDKISDEFSRIVEIIYKLRSE